MTSYISNGCQLLLRVTIQYNSLASRNPYHVQILFHYFTLFRCKYVTIIMTNVCARARVWRWKYIYHRNNWRIFRNFYAELGSLYYNTEIFGETHFSLNLVQYFLMILYLHKDWKFVGKALQHKTVDTLPTTCLNHVLYDYIYQNGLYPSNLRFQERTVWVHTNAFALPPLQTTRGERDHVLWLYGN